MNNIRQKMRVSSPPPPLPSDCSQVIPMIVCIAVAALSCQSGGAGKGQGSGAGSGGGNGGTRSGELGRGGGGGGAGCFHACGERHPYGYPPMPFCAAPCCLAVF